MRNAVSSSTRQEARAFEDWDLPSAEQGMAHAHLAAGDAEKARRWAELAREKLARVEDPEDRELIESQISELGL